MPTEDEWLAHIRAVRGLAARLERGGDVEQSRMQRRLADRLEAGLGTAAPGRSRRLDGRPLVRQAAE